MILVVDNDVIVLISHIRKTNLISVLPDRSNYPELADDGSKLLAVLWVLRVLVVV